MIFAATELDLLCGFLGGILLSISSSLHLQLKGRITGMSGIFYGIISFEKNKLYWKMSLIIGMILASSILFQCFQFTKFLGYVSLFDPLFNMESTNKWHHVVNMSIGGIFIGVGAKLMNGCTSGHGVCGLPRLQKRSFAAVMSFMASGVLTATIRNKLNESNNLVSDLPPVTINPLHQYYLMIGLIVILAFIIIINAADKNKFNDIIISLIVGIIFTFGLLLSGMSKRSKVLGFLTLNENWDPTLMMVMGGAVTSNLVTFNLILRKGNKPTYASNFDLNVKKEIDWKIYVGGLLFGVGWGFGGVCPGPAFTVIPLLGCDMLCYFLPSLGVGMYLGKVISHQFPDKSSKDQEYLKNK